jgi:hypothetical protein
MLTIQFFIVNSVFHNVHKIEPQISIFMLII